jgi:predicted transposase YbfD/YdcC
MQSTASSPCRATSPASVTVPAPALLDAFSQLPDPRRRQGTRYPLAAMLALAVAALLANHRSLLAIAEWGAAQSSAIKHALGFPSEHTPHVSTLQRLFRRLDPYALETALTTALEPDLPAERRPRGSQGVAIDGKAQRGRLRHEEQRSHPVHAVTAFCHELGTVLTQLGVDHAQHEAELTVVPALIAQVDWEGRVLTGDALYCQRAICAQVVEAGGDYLVLVDDNQPTLKADIEQVFAPPPPLAPGHGRIVMDERVARTVEKGHGRIEDRTVRVSSELAGYLDWPYAAQVFEVTRTWTRKGKTTAETRLGVTSLGADVASAARVLELKRGHWGIENRLHYVKDVTLGEDQSQVHCGATPQILAAVRNTALSLMRRAGHHAIAARLRHHSRYPEDAIALLGLTVP